MDRITPYLLDKIDALAKRMTFLYKIQSLLYAMSAMIFRNIFKLKTYLGNEPFKYDTYGYYEYDGMTMSTLPVPKVRLSAARTFDSFRSDDILICTYPKSGTHLCSDITLSLYKEMGMSLDPHYSKHSFIGLELTPGQNFPEDDPTPDLDSFKSPRIIATHLPWHLLPSKVQEGQVKVIFCSRNPKDIACSFFPFHKKVGVAPLSQTFSDFFEHFINGKAPLGDYCRYMQSWCKNTSLKRPNILVLKFEDMISNLDDAVKQIAKFVGLEGLTEDQLGNVVSANTFVNKMKKPTLMNHFILRTGKSGGWKSKFTVEQNERFEEYLKTGMKDLEKYGLTD